MLTVIITAYREPETIGKAIRHIADPQISGSEQELTLIQVSPDLPTLKAGKEAVGEIHNRNLHFIQIKDQLRGKPAALNHALLRIPPDTTEIILTDGDVYFDSGALKKFVEKFVESKADAACGRVVSQNLKRNFLGYISHLMTAAAHHRRTVELIGLESGYGTIMVKKTGFFPLSGYMLILNLTSILKLLGEIPRIPDDCLVDDAYLSYLIFNAGGKLSYVPEAEVFAKFPTTVKDYLIQKRRATGGYLQLWDYGIVRKETNSRSIWQELRYFWFPFKYASNLKEYIYSFAFFFLRAYMWLEIWFLKNFKPERYKASWVRVESTK